MSLRAPEVLAPAGDEAALRAAVRAGADAVYFGLQGWNARARATNFDDAALGRALDLLHRHGARGYVTLNTLVFDEELGALEAAVRACAEAGADAVIVQDLGVARLVRQIAPTLPIHASTQMTCTDAASVRLARAVGAERVILARELSLDEIGAIRRESEAELEVFVHGALCIAYSGQCLTSEALGGRSANRGACAQACRLPYELVVDGALRALGERAHLLSPEDLEASALVPELMALGVSALKIEGRLKGPDYVAATTRLYREAVDAAVAGVAGPGEAVRRAALQTFSRGSGPGFLAGVDHSRLVEARSCDHRGLRLGTLDGVDEARGRALLRLRLEAELARGDGLLVEGSWAGAGEQGGRVWSILEVPGGADVERAAAGQVVRVWLGPERAPEPLRELGASSGGARVWKTSDPANERAVLEHMERAPHRRPVDVLVEGALGEAPRYHARSGPTEAEVLGDAPVAVASGATSAEAVLREKLGRMGDSPFRLGALEVRLPDGALVPPGSINRARRELVERLLSSSRRRHATTAVHHEVVRAGASLPERAPAPAGLYVLCRNLGQAEAAIGAGADGVYLDFLELTGTGEALRRLRASGARTVGVAPPRIRKPGEEKIDRYLASLAPDLELVRGLGALAEPATGATEGAAAVRIGDFSLNVSNALTAAEVLGRGLSAFTPSFDLDAAQLQALLDGPLARWAEVVVHHPMPLFHMEHCVIAALLSDGKDHRDCGRPCERHQIALRDREGVEHPVEADVGCRNTVFHAAAQSAAGIVPRLQAQGVRRFRIELVREAPVEVGRIVGSYRALLAGTQGAQEVWRSLRAESTYGVVRGSLRVTR